MEKIEVQEDYCFNQDVLKNNEQTWNIVWTEWPLLFAARLKPYTTMCSRGTWLVIFFHFLAENLFFKFSRFYKGKIVKTDSPGDVAIHHMTPQDFQFFLSHPLMPLLLGHTTAQFTFRVTHQSQHFRNICQSIQDFKNICLFLLNSKHTHLQLLVMEIASP